MLETSVDADIDVGLQDWVLDAGRHQPEPRPFQRPRSGLRARGVWVRARNLDAFDGGVEGAGRFGSHAVRQAGGRILAILFDDATGCGTESRVRGGRGWGYLLRVGHLGA